MILCHTKADHGRRSRLTQKPDTCRHTRARRHHVVKQQHASSSHRLTVPKREPMANIAKASVLIQSLLLFAPKSSPNHTRKLNPALLREQPPKELGLIESVSIVRFPTSRNAHPNAGVRSLFYPYDAQLLFDRFSELLGKEACHTLIRLMLQKIDDFILRQMCARGAVKIELPQAKRTGVGKSLRHTGACHRALKAVRTALDLCRTIFQLTRLTKCRLPFLVRQHRLTPTAFADTQKPIDKFMPRHASYPCSRFKRSQSPV